MKALQRLKETMTRILAINGSYRDDGVTDQLVDIMVESLRSRGAEVSVIQLRDYSIEFCLNCRECTQQPGAAPGVCVLKDSMHDLVMKIEQADGFILASPTNFGSVTAVFKRFMERLMVYGYWPWGTPSPKFRKVKVSKKKAVLMSSSAAPGFIGRWLFGTHKQLKYTATALGAETIGSLFVGLVSTDREPDLSPRVTSKAQKLADELLSSKI